MIKGKNLVRVVGAYATGLDPWIDGIRACGDEVQIHRATMPPTRKAQRWWPGEMADYSLRWGHARFEGAHWASYWPLVTELGFLGDRMENLFIGACWTGAMAGSLMGAISGRGERFYEARRLARERPRKGHRRALLLTQTPVDWSLFHLSQENAGRADVYTNWMFRTLERLRATDMEIGVRGHPCDKHFIQPDGTVEHGSLEEALDWADVCLAFNSNSLVDAWMAGCDVVPANPASMVWEMRSQLGDSRKTGWLEDRAFIDKLATCQWSKEEIRKGIPWARIKNLA